MTQQTQQEEEPILAVENSGATPVEEPRAPEREDGGVAKKSAAENAPPPLQKTAVERNAQGVARTGSDRDASMYKKSGKLKNKVYERELVRLQEELVKLQYWVREKGLRLVVLFEGRDAAGKGGVIKRITERTNPRVVRVVALDKPTETEQTQWYFQRYVAHLPSGGQIMLFDRSWYNRALVERVMGFCTDEQYWQFMRSCPQFERMLIRDGIKLIKYWFSVSDEEQERRFQQRAHDPRRRWKLSPMDLEARRRWIDYSKAKDRMFEYTDTKLSPWYVVNSDDKRRARLNCITHLLSLVDYENVMPEPIKLPPRDDDVAYVRMPYEEQTFVPEVF
jgi:polyphosphate kinase 2